MSASGVPSAKTYDQELRVMNRKRSIEEVDTERVEPASRRRKTAHHGLEVVALPDKVSTTSRPRPVMTAKKPTKSTTTGNKARNVPDFLVQGERYYQYLTKFPLPSVACLGKLSGVISGEFALRFVDRSHPGHNLDVLIWDQEPKRNEMGEHLEKNGSIIIDEGNVGGFYTFRMYQRQDHPEVVTIFFTNQPPISEILHGLYIRTALSNFITATTACCPFARWTMNEDSSCLFGFGSRQKGEPLETGRSIILRTGHDLRDIDAAHKDSIELPPGNHGTWFFKANSERSPGGSETWAITLHNEEITPPRQPDVVVNATTFQVCTIKPLAPEKGFRYVISW
ncbi:uncharacterized protein BDZ99DRAFT_493550 [Mytilinidion resinicola]|uniref:Uncharacterized protein n=1 Tax=Mytilinidion resinicola TaxID=574789 RepID=A0A6A6ZC04_9PEZI|nr:uncharacterized protein BDZ99DRAFT_493550 [Mytilinidion resinicola]KAF2817844.1 hypothetical protein BDZ99DRAFT_493550 [Mytilinidion resinicola]